MTNIPEIFGCMVFNDAVMRQRLPKDVYKSLTETIQTGKMIDVSIANVVANAMKDWATEKGATHYTHWFQPLTSVTAEKHDSFISPIGGVKSNKYVTPPGVTAVIRRINFVFGLIANLIYLKLSEEVLLHKINFTTCSSEFSSRGTTFEFFS